MHVTMRDGNGHVEDPDVLRLRRVYMRTAEFFEKRYRDVRGDLCPIVLGSFLFLGLMPPAHAKDGNECSQSSLKGSYGYALTGLQFPSAPSPVGVGPVSAAGLMVFDGHGGLAAQDTFNNGVISRRTGSGTYAVDSDCTGSAELGGNFGRLSFNFTIDNLGREFSFLVTNPGTAQSGFAMTTGDDECTLASFKGTYRNARTGYRIAGFFSFVNTGLEVAIVDGKGNFFFPPVTQSANGVFSHPTATGTYTVSPNCLFTLDVLVVDGATSSRTHREGVVVDGGNQVWATVANTPLSTTAGIAQFKRTLRHHEDD
jgi:hypothetical protein